ncbi:hypothetical protein BGZ99_004165 [Dissophora globulifera]|uniref:Transcription factor TFIIIC triple barrel domain-containing protein n=1 Tax=Dissophora globulifera TaxID=979702 RepID=A0A9P6RL11_9FUNG|nr:hypothetical protein BGZ99_004165 [Dissophora globulifera]
MELESNTQSSFIDTAPSEIDAQFEDLRSGDLSTAASSTNNLNVMEEDDGQDWEWVEETEYFVLDFGGGGFDAEDMQKMCSSGYSLVGLDTPTPYFKAGAHTFKGFYDENAATEDMIFNMREHREHDEDGDESDDENNSDALELIAIVTKRVVFEAVDILAIQENTVKSTPDQQNADTEDGVDLSADPVAESSTTSARKKEPAVSVWKAAYEAVGLERKRRKSRTGQGATSTRGRGKGKGAARDAATEGTGETLLDNATTAKGKGLGESKGKAVARDDDDDDAGGKTSAVAMDVDTPRTNDRVRNKEETMK